MYSAGDDESGGLVRSGGTFIGVAGVVACGVGDDSGSG